MAAVILQANIGSIGEASMVKRTETKIVDGEHVSILGNQIPEIECKIKRS